jgi:DNA-binding LacI/PurR family transcriptional regulator
MTVTLRQVAEEAGVSPGTASRALHGHPQVSVDCVAKVRAVAERLGYVPLRDRSGRSRAQPLEGKRIAIAMIGIDRTLASLPVVAEAIHGAEDALAEAGAQTMLVSMAAPAEPPRSLRRVKFDGMLAKAALQGRIMEAIGGRLRATLGDTPLVWMLGRPAGAPGDVVDPDDATAGRFAAEALLEKGHRKVAIVNPKADHAAFMIRTAAFRQTIEAEGGTVVESRPAASWPVTFPLQPVMDVARVQPLVEQLSRRLAGQFAEVAVQITVPPTFISGGSLGRVRRRGSSLRGRRAAHAGPSIGASHEARFPPRERRQDAGASVR